MTLTARTLGAAAALAAAAIALTGCVAKATADPAASFTVKSTADACTVSADTAKSGTLTFDISNSGDQVTEFYLLGEDGLRIVGEVENIGPQLSRELTVNAGEGTYVTACKPGMKGDGIRADFTVTGSGEEPSVSADDQAMVDQALANYQAYVQDQSDQLVAKTRQFVDLYKSGDDDAECTVDSNQPAATAVPATTAAMMTTGAAY